MLSSTRKLNSGPSPSHPPISQDVHQAASTGDHAGVRRSLQGKGPKGEAADPRSKSSVAVLAAANARNADEVTSLFSKHLTSTEATDVGGRTPLLIAVEKDDPKTIHALLEREACVDATDGRGYQAVHIAAELGHSRALHVILNFSQRPHEDHLRQHTPMNKSPLHLAVEASNADRKSKFDPNSTPEQCISMIVKFCPELLADCQCGQTPVHVATRARNSECLKLLLGNDDHDVGPDVTVPDRDKHSALYYCILNRDHASAEVILGGYRNEEDYHRLDVDQEAQIQLEHPDARVIKVLIFRHRNFSGKGSFNVRLRNAAKRGNLKELKHILNLLLPLGAQLGANTELLNVNDAATAAGEENATALHYAVEFALRNPGKKTGEGCVDALVQHDAHLTNGCKSELFRAIESRNPAIVTVLLRAVNLRQYLLQPNLSVLVEAIRAIPSMAMIKAILNKAVNVNLTGSVFADAPSRGVTPIDAAIGTTGSEGDKVAIIRLLLQAGASVTATVLHFYLKKQRVDILSELCTALRRAAGCAGALSRATSALLSVSFDETGNALQVSCSRAGSFKVAKLLLDDFGADPTATSDHQNKSPIEIASGCDDDATVRLLFSKGATCTASVVVGYVERGNVEMLSAIFRPCDKPLARQLLGTSVDTRGNALQRACGKVLRGNNREELVELLLSFGANPNTISSGLRTAPVELAATEDDGATVRLLLTNGATPTKGMVAACVSKGDLPLLESIFSDTGITKLGIKAAELMRGELPDGTNLLKATKRKCLKTVTFIVETIKKITPSQSELTAYIRMKDVMPPAAPAAVIALTEKAFGILKLLVKHGGLIPPGSFFDLVKRNDTSTVGVLLNMVEAVDAQVLLEYSGADGNPIQVAASHTAAAMVKLLLDTAADPAKYANSHSPDHPSVPLLLTRSVDVVQVLLKYLGTAIPEEALFYHIIQCNVRIVDLMLSKTELLEYFSGLSGDTETEERRAKRACEAANPIRKASGEEWTELFSTVWDIAHDRNHLSWVYACFFNPTASVVHTLLFDSDWFKELDFSELGANGFTLLFYIFSRGHKPASGTRFFHFDWAQKEKILTASFMMFPGLSPRSLLDWILTTEKRDTEYVGFLLEFVTGKQSGAADVEAMVHDLLATLRSKGAELERIAANFAPSTEQTLQSIVRSVQSDKQGDKFDFCLKMIETIEALGVDKASELAPAFECALRGCKISFIRALFEHGADPMFNSINTLTEGLKDCSVMRTLLELDGVAQSLLGVTKAGKSALQLAMETGNESIIKLILSYLIPAFSKVGATDYVNKISAEHGTAIEMAAFTLKMGWLVERLRVDFGATVSIRLFLCYYIMSQGLPLVKQVLSPEMCARPGGYLDGLPEHGTALQVACTSSDCFPLVEYLIEMGTQHSGRPVAELSNKSANATLQEPIYTVKGKEVTQLLIDKGGAHVTPALFLDSIRRKLVSKVQLLTEHLLEEQADVQQHIDVVSRADKKLIGNALHVAAFANNLEMIMAVVSLVRFHFGGAADLSYLERESGEADPRTAMQIVLARPIKCLKYDVIEFLIQTGCVVPPATFLPFVRRGDSDAEVVTNLLKYVRQTGSDQVMRLLEAQDSDGNCIQHTVIADSADILGLLFEVITDVGLPGQGDVVYANHASEGNNRPPILLAKSAAVLRLLIEKGADVETLSTDPEERTILHTCVENGWVEMVALLLEKDANWAARDVSGQCPLHLVNQVEICDKLMKAGSCWHWTSSNAKCCLFKVLLAGHVDVAEEIVNSTTDWYTKRCRERVHRLITATDYGGVSILEFVIRSGFRQPTFTQSLSLLLDVLLKLDRRDAIKIARKQLGQTLLRSVVRTFFSAGVEPSGDILKKMFRAGFQRDDPKAGGGDGGSLFLFAFELLLTKGAAVSSWAVPFLKVILFPTMEGADMSPADRGALTSEGDTALHLLAIHTGTADWKPWKPLWKFFLEDVGLDPTIQNSAKQTPRQLLPLRNKHDELDELLDNHEATEKRRSKSADYYTRALRKAAAVGDEKTVNGILKNRKKNGANPNAVDDWTGTTPIIAAAIGGTTRHACCIDLLVHATPPDEPGDPNYAVKRSSHTNQPATSYTALHFAAQFGWIPCCKTLTAVGCNVNAQTADAYGKSTGLHLAAANDKLKVIGVLLEANANTNLRNSDGATPLMVAAINQNWEICRLLVLAGCDRRIENLDDNRKTAKDYAIQSFAGKAAVDYANFEFLDADYNISLLDRTPQQLVPWSAWTRKAKGRGNGYAGLQIHREPWALVQPSYAAPHCTFEPQISPRGRYARGSGYGTVKVRSKSVPTSPTAYTGPIQRVLRDYPADRNTYFSTRKS